MDFTGLKPELGDPRIVRTWDAPCQATIKVRFTVNEIVVRCGKLGRACEKKLLNLEVSHMEVIILYRN